MAVQTTYCRHPEHSSISNELPWKSEIMNDSFVTCRYMDIHEIPEVRWFLHDLCSLPNIIRIIKSRRMGWAGHVGQMWRRGTCISYVRFVQEPHGITSQKPVFFVLLFLLHINDLPSIIMDKSIPILFADDTSIIVKNSNRN
jgi:hypothetical protein